MPVTITPLPTPPNRGMDPEEFIAAADTFLAALPNFATEAQAAVDAANLAGPTVTDFARTLFDDADAATAQATLGLVIGTNVQAYDATLTAVAGVTTAANKLIYATGVDTFAATDLTVFARTILDDADATTARATLGVVIGTNVQAFHANLTALAGLSLVADRLIYANGAGTVTLTTFTSFARTLLDDADAATARTTLGCGTAAAKNTGTSGNTVPLLDGANTFSALQTFSAGITLTPAATPATTSAGYLGAPQNVQNGAYGLVMTDAGKQVYHSSATPHTYTIPANSSVAFPVGTKIEIVNDNGAGALTIAITTDTMRWIPGGTTGSRTLAANGSCVISKITSTSWQISGVGLS